MKYFTLKKKEWYVILIGATALFWFLIRVIPKPSRATYPCQRAAFPIAASFVIYLISLFASAKILKKTSSLFYRRKYFPAFASILGLVAVLIINVSLQHDNLFAKTAAEADFIPNNPIGEASGNLSGKVVWVWDPNAVDETCKNTWLESENWWMPDYTNQAAVEQMLVNGVKYLSGKNDIQDAWDYIFRYHNELNTDISTAYEAGQKIAIKTNFVTCLSTNMDGHDKVQNLNMTDLAPQLMWSMLGQLVNQVGVAQSDISIGDPSALFPNQYYDMLIGDFPDVIYLSKEDGDGRTITVAATEGFIKFSDGSGQDAFPTYFVEADYMINMSVVKHHGSAGFSNNTKNHFGSNMRHSASHMHSSLVGEKSGYNYYRHFVDLMGHEHLGGKTVLYIGDMLWSSSNAWSVPKIFQQSPFNNDYPSSLLIAVDPVSIESVALDFISNESWEEDNLAKTAGVDDFLIQAADPDTRPEGISYDPEGDGSLIDYSLGIYEHWNNVSSKQYNKNLGKAEGILLIKNFLDGSQQALSPPTDLVLNYDVLNTEITISWNDNSIDEDGFFLEKSTDGGNNYTELAETGADINTFTDTEIDDEGTVYYRVKTIRDVESSTFIENSIQYGPNAIKSFNSFDHDITVYPVPAIDRINIAFGEQHNNEPVCVSLINTDGRMIMQENNMTQSGLIELNIEHLNPGSYILNVVNGNKRIYSQLITVK